MHASTLPQGLDFLLTLDAFVRSDASSPCFEGSLSVGLELPQGEVWWNARFGRTAETWFSTSRSQDARVILLVASDTEDVEMAGDDEVLARFLDRYFTRKSFISVFATQHSTKERRFP
jgi:hypothetical protein